MHTLRGPIIEGKTAAVKSGETAARPFFHLVVEGEGARARAYTCHARKARANE